MKFVNKFDGKTYEINPAHGTTKQWKEGRCWAFFCNNGIKFIHLSKKGKATYGYCYHLLSDEKRIKDGFRYGGRWVVCENGKLKDIKQFLRKR
jgi:hypothetical protein